MLKWFLRPGSPHEILDWVILYVIMVALLANASFGPQCDNIADGLPCHILWNTAFPVLTIFFGLVITRIMAERRKATLQEVTNDEINEKIKQINCQLTKLNDDMRAIMDKLDKLADR